MTENPYATPLSDAASISVGASNQHGDNDCGKRLDTLSRITVGSCALWFGMMVLGRFLDKNAPPLADMFLFYGVLGFAPSLGLYGALSALKRKRYAMSLIGASCMAIPIIGPWCGLTIPIGIWSLILLCRPAIRDSFKSATTGDNEEYVDADDAIAHASRLDRIGEWDAAISAYRDAADRWPEHARYIDNCIAEIAKKQSAAT